MNKADLTQRGWIEIPGGQALIEGHQVYRVRMTLPGPNQPVIRQMSRGWQIKHPGESRYAAINCRDLAATTA